MSVKLANTNQEVILRLKEYFGGSWSVVKKKKSHHQDAWEWVLNGKGSEVFLRILSPFLIIKKKEAEVALIFREKQKVLNKKRGWQKPYSEEAIQELADSRNQLLDLHPSGGNGRRTYPRGW